MPCGRRETPVSDGGFFRDCNRAGNIKNRQESLPEITHLQVKFRRAVIIITGFCSNRSACCGAVE
jgi:hypothetical protein